LGKTLVSILHDSRSGGVELCGRSPISGSGAGAAGMRWGPAGEGLCCAGVAYERVLAVGAHPDDCEFHAGGTLAALAAEGARVTLAVCTDGAAGGQVGGVTLSASRRREAESAAAALGAAELVWLGHPDGALRDDEALIGQLVEAIRRHRPQLVLGHDPSTLWTRVGDRYHPGHTDHRAAGRALLAAVYPRAPLPTFFPEQLAAGLAPWWVPELWLFDTDEPDFHRDVEATLAAKHASLACHDSQNVGGSLVRASERRAALARASTGTGSEAFRRLPLTPG
jgi:LmbE family N-acetylglucosaminyl deacetylase